MIRLLVVDDEKDVCDFVKKFFTERDFDVLTAHNGREAVDSFVHNRPEIVLLDVKMPVLDGLDALRAIRKMDTDVKVIMITAVDDKEKMTEAEKIGVYDYITKPLLLEQLERVVLIAAEQIKMAGKRERG